MTKLNLYTIFWKPTDLQSGAAATLPAAYQAALTQLAQDYVGHSLSSVATQYYQTVGAVTTYYSGLIGSVPGNGSDSGTYVDTDPYPASACVPAAVNCVSDAQVQAEIANVLTAKGWTGGANKIFVVSFSPRVKETGPAANTCSNADFCAYHGHFTDGAGATVIYANMPYPNNLAGCWPTGTPSPHGLPAADAEASAMAHEITEAVTDPESNAWYTALGNEIGDLCAYTYGTNSFDYSSAKSAYLANEWWNGHFYEVQMMWDNHYGVCAQYGP